MIFDLYKLGWYSFQQLSLTILREILGQSVESFLPSGDGGRDGSFSGNWKISDTEDLSGNFVFQCKHTGRPSHNLSFSEVSFEIANAERLVKKGKCDCYILITNAGVSGTVEEEITSALYAVGVKKVRVFGSTWVCDQIRDNKKLRMLMPRVYGLGDLSEILDARAYGQARRLLDSLREDLSKVVITQTYDRAVKAINDHGFVLLIGEPAAGKTTIASLLSMAALDQWGTFTMKLEKAGELVQRWNPDDTRQFFWVDDAFGVTQYESPLAYEWNAIAIKLKAMIRDGVKVVLTSRDYIYNGARKDLKHSAFPMLEESQVVIDVHHLLPEERQQILYNHLKLGKQSPEFRKKIKPFLEEISKLEKFVPEIARRLSDPAFTRNLILYQTELKKFVEEPAEFLAEIIEGLDKHSKAALALIYMRNNNLESPLELSIAEKKAIDRLGSSLGGCTEALENMRDSLVYLTPSPASFSWKFKHPTIGDAYSSILIKNPELLEIFIQGSTTEELTNTITCGDVGLEKSVIILPKFFDQILKKLEQFKYSSLHKTESWSAWEANRRLHSFLSGRCSKDFLELYTSKNPGILADAANPGLYLDYSPTVRLAVRLHSLGLLPEENRKKLVQRISEYTVKGDDFYIFENKALQKIFTANEYKNLRKKVREDFIPNIGEWRSNIESEYSGHNAPYDHMDPYLEQLRTLKKTFSQIKFSHQIDSEISNMNEWVEEAEKSREKPIPARKKLETGPATQSFTESRSIFDDIDE